MSVFHLPYKVTVDVEVDTDAGRVTRVRIIDESVQWDDEGEILTADWLPIKVAATSENIILEKAQRIAEETEWPAWDHS